MNIDYNLISNIVFIILLFGAFYVYKKGKEFENKEMEESKKLNKELEELKKTLKKNRGPHNRSLQLICLC